MVVLYPGEDGGYLGWLSTATIDNRQAGLRGLLLWKVGVYENTPRVRCTIRTHTQHTHNSFYTVIMLQQDLILVFAFFLDQHHVIRNNNHKWVKNCRKQIPSKKQRRKNSTKWVTILNTIKHTLYSWSHAKNSWKTSDTFWAIASLLRRWAKH